MPFLGDYSCCFFHCKSILTTPPLALRGEVDSKTCFLKTEGSECAFYKLLGAILRLFSQLIEFLLCSFVTRKNQSAGTEIRDSNKALRSGRFVFAVVVFTRQIRERSNSLCTFPMQRYFPNAQTFTLCNLGCTRHNANKFAFCSRLHKLSPFFLLVCR